MNSTHIDLPPRLISTVSTGAFATYCHLLMLARDCQCEPTQNAPQFDLIVSQLVAPRRRSYRQLTRHLAELVDTSFIETTRLGPKGITVKLVGQVS